MKNPLSTEFMIACAIYKLNKNNEPAYLNKLVCSKSLHKKMEPYMFKRTISSIIDTLFDWGAIKAEYGETEPDKQGRLLFITKETEPLIKHLYKKYYKKL